MSCLHLISVPLATIEAQLKPLIGANDGVVLMGDALTDTTSALLLHVPIYAWALSDGSEIRPSITVVNSDEMVKLTTQFDKTMSWHQAE